MRRRIAIAACVVVAALALWMAHGLDWSTIVLRGANRMATISWVPIHLSDGRTLRLNLQDGEMLENVEPEPFPGGRAGLVAQWHRQIEEAPPQSEAEWPAWLEPYPGAEQISNSPHPWAVISATERRAFMTRAFRTTDPPERVIEHYRRKMEGQRIVVAGQTRGPAGVIAIRGESDGKDRSVNLETHAGGFSISYTVKEYGQFKTLPGPPVLELSLASVDEAGQFVRLRNAVDGEILHLPFSVLMSDQEYQEMTNARAAHPPDFLPAYPGGREIMPPTEDPRMINIAFQVDQQPPSRIAAFYKQRVEEAGFKLETEDSGSDASRPYAGFSAVAADGRRVMVSAFETGGETHAQVMYFKQRPPQ